MYEENAIVRPSYDGAIAPVAGSTAGILEGLPPAVSREVTQVLAQFQYALMRPRNIPQVFKKIEDMCSRVGLAASATYSYPRGNTAVTGPSIRLAEAVAKAYGNVKCGIEEIDSSGGESKVRAYALDLETNMLEEKIFTVKHIRDTKSGSKKLTDQRDIYELIANNGSRRLRACILSVIPSDIIDYAMDVCSRTIQSKVQITDETVGKMLVAFSKFGVNRDMLEARIQTVLENMSASKYIAMQNIYSTLNDGEAKVEDFFDMNLSDAGKVAAKAKEQAVSSKKPEETKKPAATKKPTQKKEESAPADQAEPVQQEAAEEQGPETYQDDDISDDYDPETGEVYDSDEGYEAEEAEAKSFDDLWN